MPRKTFSIIQGLIEDITSVTQKDILVQHSIQRALDLWAQDWSHPYLMQDAFITTVAPNTTGTASITNASTAVVGTGTSWTTALEGRKIRFNGENAYYRILTVTDTTNLVLEVPYQGDTDATATLNIYKDEYRLPADLANYRLPRQIENGIPLFDIDPDVFDLLDARTTSEGDPFISSLIGSLKDEYTTGTVEATQGTSILTGTGTSWDTVEGLGRGTRITQGTTVFTVKSVDSAMQITIYETFTATISALATYTVHLNNYRLLLKDIPQSAQNVYFRYQRIPAPLENVQDLPDMPEQDQWFLIDAGTAWVWASKDKEHSRWLENRLDELLVKLRKSRVSATKVYRRLPFPISDGKYQPPIPGNYGRIVNR